MKIVRRIFVDGLSGMTTGWFCTFVIGTILQQIGNWIGGDAGGMLQTGAAALKVFAGAAIGAGMAYKLGESALTASAAAAAGMIGAYSTQILDGSILTDGKIVLDGPGQPLTAFAAAYIGIEIGRIIAGQIRPARFLAPFLTIIIGGGAGILISPYIEGLIEEIGKMIQWGTQQEPWLMGIVVAVLMGIVCTLPVNPAAVASMLNLSGIAAGAAAIGCSAQMVGFAAAGLRENGIGGFLAQGIGTSMLQLPNILRRPWIWIPSIVSSGILGAVSTVLLKMPNSSLGAVMGTMGLSGAVSGYHMMEEGVGSAVLIFIMYAAAPAVLTYFIAEAMRRAGIIKNGDMKLDI